MLCFVPMHPHITTGKTATLKAILSIFGLGDRCLQRGKVTAEALLRLSSLSSFPILVDDISSETKMEEIAVSYFNAAGHTTVASGTIYLRGTILLSSNRLGKRKAKALEIHMHFCGFSQHYYNYFTFFSFPLGV